MMLFLPLMTWVRLLIWFAIVLFDGLWAGPLFRTEGLRALVADEMLRGGDWMVPHCYHKPLLTKPPGAYIVMAPAVLQHMLLRFTARAYLAGAASQ